MLNQLSQTQKSSYYMPSFILKRQKTFIKTENILVVSRAQEDSLKRVIAEVHRVSFEVNKIF